MAVLFILKVGKKCGDFSKYSKATEKNVFTNGLIALFCDTNYNCICLVFELKTDKPKVKV